MPKLYLFFIVFLILFSCTKKKLQIDFTEKITPTNDRLNKIRFFNSQIGFIVGGKQFSNPMLLKTNDGGITWHEVTLPLNAEQKEIYGLDIFKDGKIITVGYGGTIFISNDTGNTFNYVQHNSWKELKDIAFKDANNALIIGGSGFNQGHISEFNADGNGANLLKEERNFEIADIDFIDASTAYLSGYGAIMKSIDGGNTWNFTSAKNDFFKAMAWKNAEEGIAVGYEGSIHKTTNGGETWKVIRNGNNITKKKIHFIDVERNTNKTVIAVGEKGIVFISTNDGDSWVQTNNFATIDLRGIVFKNETTCMLVGDEGKVFEIKL